MSASHRKLARLPLEIFDNLQGGEETLSPEELRSAICDKLKRFRTRHTHHKARSVSTSLKTVGDFLRASPLTVMQALDPLLTFGTSFKLSTSLLAILVRMPHVLLPFSRSQTIVSKSVLSVLSSSRQLPYLDDPYHWRLANPAPSGSHHSRSGTLFDHAVAARNHGCIEFCHW